MRKKTIEKVPYLTLPKVSRKKGVEYIGVTAFRNIAHERHLFLEVYRNDRACRDIPAVRIVLDKNDFGTFFPETGKWSRRRIMADTWDGYGLVWQENRPGRSEYTLKEENILYSQEDLERIRTFTDDSGWSGRPWWGYIDRRQKDITAAEYNGRAARKYERRQQALKERAEQTPELPEDRILDYADRVIFHGQHYLYYKKHGGRAAVACSACGSVSDERWKPGTGYEGQFVRTIREPRMGGAGTCPACGAAGEYMPQGRAKGFHRKSSYLFLGQGYGKKGMVFRYIEASKEWQLELACGEREPEMYSSGEKLRISEIARVYFEPGKKRQTDFHKHNPYTGEDFWDDCNLGGLQNIPIREAPVMPETYRNMNGTFIQYSGMEEFQGSEGAINAADYIERYIQMPQIEMLAKMGLVRIVRELAECHYGIVADDRAERVDAFLGIRKEHVKQLVEHKGDTDILKIMQIEKRTGQRWTDGQIEQIAETGMDCTQIMQAMGYVTMQKLLNRISRYAGCEYGTMCSRASARLKAVARTYSDYLGMREALGYDMGSTVYLFPRDLDAGHARMVQEYNRQEADKRILEAAERYPLIKKNYRRFRKMFYYGDGDYIIRPARSAEEIVMEGRILHHCVGGDGYLDRHNKGERIILFLRDAAEAEMPYVTVEIDVGTLRILQWYGAHDKKPEEEVIGRWLENYRTRLQCMRDGTQREAGESGTDGTAVPLLA